MIRLVAHFNAATVATDIAWRIFFQRAQSIWSQQIFFNARHNFLRDRNWNELHQRLHGEQLVGPLQCVNALGTVKRVGKLILIVVDIARETFLRLGQRGAPYAGVLLLLWRPFNQRGQQSAPKSVNFNWFSHARRDHGGANFGVHPSQLRARIGGHKQSVGGVNANSVARAFGEGVEDIHKRWK